MKRYYWGILTLLLIFALSLSPSTVLAGGEDSSPLDSDNTSDNVTLYIPSENVSDNTTLVETVTDNITGDNITYFTLVVLPDTQNYSTSYPDIFKSQTQWIADNWGAENIVYVAHAGDIVNHADNQIEWDNAIEAMDILGDNGTPYITTVGNHDISRTSGLQPYNDAFGSAEAYALFDIGDTSYIIIAVNANEGYVEGAIVWARGILEQHGDRKAIILVHYYIDESGWQTDFGIPVWEGLIKPSSNIFLVVSGHFLCTEGWSTDVTDNGTLVNNLQANYQHYENGGNGWLRLYKFNDDLTEIEVKTYSPYLNLYRSNAESEFTVDLINSNAPPKKGEKPSPTPPPSSPSPPSGGGSSGGGGSGGGGFMPGETGALIQVFPTSTSDLFKVRMISEHTGYSFQRLLTREELEELLKISNLPAELEWLFGEFNLVKWKGAEPMTPEALVRASEYEPPPNTLEPVIPQP